MADLPWRFTFNTLFPLPLWHIDEKRQEKGWYIPNPATHIRTLVHIFIPFGLHTNPGRPITIWSAMKFPDGLRSFAGLRICGASSVGCDGTFRTPSVSGLTSCPSFSFSATSGTGGASSNCILRSSAASSDFNCFSSSSLWHKHRRFTRLPDFGGQAQPPAGASAFRGCSKRFERLKRHLAVFMWTLKSVCDGLGRYHSNSGRNHLI